MNDFEQELSERLRTRAATTKIDLDPTAIKSNEPRTTAPPSAPALRPILAVAAAAFIAVGGLVVLDRSRSTEPVPVAAPPAVLDDPYRGLPTSGPSVDDHWHIAYGINLCGEWIDLVGDLEDVDGNGEFINDDFVSTGIHSHDDGLMHIHPHSPLGAGANATLGVFFDNYGIELGDDGLQFTDAALDQPIVAEYERCGDVDEFVVVVWPDASDRDEKIVVDRGLAGVPLGADRMAIALVALDNPNTIEQPPSAAIELPDLEAGTPDVSVLPHVPDRTAPSQTSRPVASSNE